MYNTIDDPKEEPKVEEALIEPAEEIPTAPTEPMEPEVPAETA